MERIEEVSQGNTLNNLTVRSDPGDVSNLNQDTVKSDPGTYNEINQQSIGADLSNSADEDLTRAASSMGLDEEEEDATGIGIGLSGIPARIARKPTIERQISDPTFPYSSSTGSSSSQDNLIRIAMPQPPTLKTIFDPPAPEEKILDSNASKSHGFVAPIPLTVHGSFRVTNDEQRRGSREYVKNKNFKLFYP